MFHQFSREQVQGMLRKYYRPLSLDATGRSAVRVRSEAAEPIAAPDPARVQHLGDS